VNRPHGCSSWSKPPQATTSRSCSVFAPARRCCASIGCDSPTASRWRSKPPTYRTPGSLVWAKCSPTVARSMPCCESTTVCNRNGRKKRSRPNCAVRTRPNCSVRTSVSRWCCCRDIPSTPRGTRWSTFVPSTEVTATSSSPPSIDPDHVPDGPLNGVGPPSHGRDPQSFPQLGCCRCRIGCLGDRADDDCAGGTRRRHLVDPLVVDSPDGEPGTRRAQRSDLANQVQTGCLPARLRRR